MMIRALHHSLVLCFLSFTTLISAQSPPDSGYTGYSLSLEGDANSVIYETASTSANASTTVPEPDVYLNASVQVGEIGIDVANLTAKINLDAQVLQLLQFNAGVDLSVDRVSLSIVNVTAKVLLEARLENLVRMINDTLESLDLNPALATLGQAAGEVVDGVVEGITGGAPPPSSPVVPRSYELENNILYSVNDYSGNTHTNRVLAQNGDIIDEFLDNDGHTYNQQVVGSHLTDMTLIEENQNVVKNGQKLRELEYLYTPMAGISAVSAIYLNAEGEVVATRVLSESSGGGSSTIGGL